MLELVARFCTKNDGKFNDELIYGMRDTHEMTKYIAAACQAIAQLAPDYIEYVGYEYLDNRERMLERDKESSAIGDSKNVTRININETYAKEVKFNFKCTVGGEVIMQSFSIWIPMLIDNSHFYIRGNKYSAPLQIIDAIAFSKKNVLVLKTIARSLKFTREKVSYTDIYGKKFSMSKIMINITKKPVPVLLYYFATFGFFKTMKYFGVDEYISIYTDENTEASTIPSDRYLFKFGKHFLGVDKEAFDEIPILRTFVATVLATQKRTMNVDFIRNPTRWTMLLGESISIQKSHERGLSLIKTFNNMLDYHTRDIINQLVPGTPRENMYAVVRWLFVNYSILTNKDDGLQNKRLRLAEYLISPFIKVFTEKIYRFLNTRRVEKSVEHLNDVFKIRSSILLNAIIGKISHAKTGLGIAKFSSEFNDDALINTLLLCTKAGPGSPSEKSKRLSTKLRQFSIDYVGALSFIEGQSDGAPGITHFITPLNDTFDSDKKIFNIDPVLIKK